MTYIAAQNKKQIPIKNMGRKNMCICQAFDWFLLILSLCLPFLAAKLAPMAPVRDLHGRSGGQILHATDFARMAFGHV